MMGTGNWQLRQYTFYISYHDVYVFEKYMAIRKMPPAPVRDTLLHKLSPPVWTNQKSMFLTHAGEFCLCRREAASRRVICNEK